MDEETKRSIPKAKTTCFLDADEEIDISVDHLDSQTSLDDEERRKKQANTIRMPTGLRPLGASQTSKPSARNVRPSLRYGETMAMAIEKNPVRRIMSEAMASQRYEAFTGTIIFANFVVIVLETDVRANQARYRPGTEEYAADAEVLTRVYIMNLMFLAFYAIECGVRFFVQRKKFFTHGWNIFDLLIVVVGIFWELLQSFVDSETGDVNLFRSMRMVRLLRLPRLLISFEELYALVCGLTNCMKTLLWAAALIFLLMTVYAIIAVEYIHPLMADLEQEGAYTLCAWCPGAFQSIMHANLTFFQIVSGDSWSFLARALIEKHPWTAVIFVSVILTVVFGLLNLVVAAIVDTAAKAREADVQCMAYAKQKERDEAWNNFATLVVDLDEDDDGEISIDELREGVTKSPELYALLSVMGVTSDDLVSLFEVMDEDGNGVVTHAEFVAQLFKMKTSSQSTNTYYIKHYVEDVRKMIIKHTDVLNILCRKDALGETAEQTQLRQTVGGAKRGGTLVASTSQRRTQAGPSRKTQVAGDSEGTSSQTRGGMIRKQKTFSDGTGSSSVQVSDGDHQSNSSTKAESKPAGFLHRDTFHVPQANGEFHSLNDSEGGTGHDHKPCLEDLVTTLTSEVATLRGSVDLSMQDMSRELSELRDHPPNAPPPTRDLGASHPNQEVSRYRLALPSHSVATSKGQPDGNSSIGTELEVSVGPSSAPSLSRCCNDQRSHSEEIR